MPLNDQYFRLNSLTSKENILQKDTRTPMFTAALFIIVRTWKQPKWPAAEEWTKMWYVHTMEYYLTIKRKETESFVEMWMDLEMVIQDEVSQKEKTRYCISMHIWGIYKSGTDEPICKAEIETQTQRTNTWTPRGGRRSGMNWETGTDIHTPLCIKQTTNENLLYSTGTFTPCSVVT